MNQPRSDVHAPEDEEEEPMELPDDLNLDGGDDKDQEEGELTYISSVTFVANTHTQLTFLMNIESLLMNIKFSILMNIQFSFLIFPMKLSSEYSFFTSREYSVFISHIYMNLLVNIHFSLLMIIQFYFSYFS